MNLKTAAGTRQAGIELTYLIVLLQPVLHLHDNIIELLYSLTLSQISPDIKYNLTWSLLLTTQ